MLILCAISVVLCINSGFILLLLVLCFFFGTRSLYVLSFVY